MKRFFILLILLSFLSPALAEPELFYKLGGKSLSYEELIAPKKAVLFIWTTWCPTCRSEFRRLSKECSLFNGVKILLVNSGEEEAKVKKFIEAMDLKECVKKNIILDSNSVLSRKFAVFSIPAFIIIKNGEPVYRTFFVNQELLDAAFKDGD